MNLNYKIHLAFGEVYERCNVEAIQASVVRYVDTDELRERTELTGTFKLAGDVFRRAKVASETKATLPIRVYIKNNLGSYVLNYEGKISLMSADVFDHLQYMIVKPIQVDQYSELEEIANKQVLMPRIVQEEFFVIENEIDIRIGYVYEVIQIISNILSGYNIGITCSNNFSELAPYLYNRIPNLWFNSLSNVSKFSLGVDLLNISFAEMQNYFKRLFNLEYVLTNGVLSFVHPSEYIYSGNAIDFTNYKGKNWVPDLPYSFDEKLKNIRREIWQVFNTDDADFDVQPIEYANFFTKSEIYELKELFTNINHIINNYDIYNTKSGYVFASVDVVDFEGNPLLYLAESLGQYSNTNKYNAQLSLPTLLREFQLYNRAYTNGTVNPGAFYEPDIYSQVTSRFTEEFLAPLYDINDPMVDFRKYYKIEQSDECKLVRVELPLNGGLAKWQLKF